MTSMVPLIALLASAMASAGEPRVSLSGVGPVRIGMTERALASAIGRDVAAPVDADEAACRYIAAEMFGADVHVMLLDGRVARIDIDGPGLRTLSGASVGDGEADVVARYGKAIVVSNHFYTGPEGKYLTLMSRDGTSGIRFETDGEVIVRYYVGTAEAVALVEGCQ